MDKYLKSPNSTHSVVVVALIAEVLVAIGEIKYKPKEVSYLRRTPIGVIC
jgi:hypothetical protein